MHSFTFLILVFSFNVFVNCQLCKTKKSCCQYTFDHALCSVTDTETQSTCRCSDGCYYSSGGCCKDFNSYCQRGKPDPCLYSHWGRWSECSTKKACDIGYRSRTRYIIQTGNFKSSEQCNASDLKEHQKCGSLDCYEYKMKPIQYSEYSENNTHFETAIFKYLSGNCDQFKENETNICIMCSDYSKCSDVVIEKGNELTIRLDNCTGKWVKLEHSSNEKTCPYWIYPQSYAFN